MLQLLLNIVTMTVYKLHIYSKKDRPNYSILTVWMQLQYTRNIFMTSTENSGCQVLLEKSKIIKFTYLIILMSPVMRVRLLLLLKGWFFPFQDKDHLPLLTLRNKAVCSKSAFLLLYLKFHCFTHCPLYHDFNTSLSWALSFKLHIS